MNGGPHNDLWFVPQPWTEFAMCATVDPELWFPEYGAGKTQRIKAAVAVCRTCEVRAECLSYAIENNETWGIWGGLTYKQRQEAASE